MNTLTELLDTSVERYRDRTAVKSWSPRGVHSWSYRDLSEAARDVAAMLQARGVHKGDRIVLWGPNGLEWVASFLGCMRVGAVAVPFDIRARVEFLAQVMGKTEAKYLIGGVEQLSLRGGEQPNVIQMQEIINESRGMGARLESVEVAGEDIAEVLFTSGTTGAPKGVILTHANLMANLQAVNAVVPCSKEYRLLSLLPLSHAFEMTIGLLFLISGGASITYLGSLQPAIIFQAMKDEQITCMGCVPQVLQLFMAAIEREISRSGRGGSWRTANQIASRLPMGLRRHLFKGLHRRMGGHFQFFVCGGAYLDPALAAKWERLGIKVLQGYGMTEASPVVSCDSLSQRDHRYVGRPLPGVEVRIAADGEILARGPNITPGYWNDPGSTQGAFEEGWYKTGDIGYLSPAGRLKLVGRKKNIIVLPNGMNVYPEDIEEAIKTDVRVQDCVVAGLSKGPQGTEVHAILLMKDADQAQDVIRGANRRLGSHQQVRGYTVWPQDDFPRTPTLKPKRTEVLEALRMKAEVL